MPEKLTDPHEITKVLFALLHLSDDAVVEMSSISNVQPDMFIRDGGDIYVVEVANTASLQKVAMLTLYQRLLVSEDDTHFVLAAKVVPTSVLDAAEQAGVDIVPLPRDVSVTQEHSVQNARFTTEKAWRVSSRLLKEKTISIRQIALKEGLSYGWTHAVVKKLIARGIVTQRGNRVEITDTNKLLDAAAWERPLDDLRLGVVKTHFSNTYEAAETLTRTAEGWNMPLAFTSYTSASLYIGYGARHDSVYCYVSNKDAFQEMKRENGGGGGIDVVFYSADRDVFTVARSREGILVVSPSQTLLDLSGLGYSARDFAQEIVKRYADITENNE